MQKRERWGSRIGLILAMAGNAVGLGNFLRFPVQAAQNGGGAFMIPYFVAFILLAIPLMWVEWTIGRNGGKYGHGSMPGMLDAMWNNPIAKYLGVSGLFVSTVVIIYYTYIESWTLGFSFFSLMQTYFGMDTFETMGGFLHSYTGEGDGYFQSILPAYIFLLITMAMNFYILAKGIKHGIEKFAKVAMPLLLLFGLFLAIWTFTVGTPNPVEHPDWSVSKGFAFIWNPDFSQITNAKIWLAAAGQIFFTLSVGMGTLLAYASYLREKEDIALSGLATASVNEFTEVVLGGTIAIPIAVAFFGLTQTQIIAEGGSYDLGFVSMPLIFQSIPMGQYLGFMWFFLLFFAGITSSVAMAQPLISFMKEQFNFTHKKATAFTAGIIFICVQFVVIFHQHGFLDEMDYWAGTFGLVIVALIEVIVFGWIFGINNSWKLLNKGADIKIPKIFKFIIKWITPSYLLIILILWTVQGVYVSQFFENSFGIVFPDFMRQPGGAIDKLLLFGIPDGDIAYRWIARGVMISIFVGFAIMVRIAWQRNKHEYDHFKK